MESGHAGGAASLFADVGRGFRGLAVSRHYHYGFIAETQVAQILQAEFDNCRN